MAHSLRSYIIQNADFTSKFGFLPHRKCIFYFFKNFSKILPDRFCFTGLVSGSQAYFATITQLSKTTTTKKEWKKEKQILTNHQGSLCPMTKQFSTGLFTATVSKAYVFYTSIFIIKLHFPPKWNFDIYVKVKSQFGTPNSWIREYQLLSKRGPVFELWLKSLAKNLVSSWSHSTEGV